jgi:hypothetical protein
MPASIPAILDIDIGANPLDVLALTSALAVAPIGRPLRELPERWPAGRGFPLPAIARGTRATRHARTTGMVMDMQVLVAYDANPRPSLRVGHREMAWSAPASLPRASLAASGLATFFRTLP